MLNSINSTIYIPGLNVDNEALTLGQAKKLFVLKFNPQIFQSVSTGSLNVSGTATVGTLNVTGEYDLSGNLYLLSSSTGNINTLGWKNGTQNVWGFTPFQQTANTITAGSDKLNITYNNGANTLLTLLGNGALSIIKDTSADSDVNSPLILKGAGDNNKQCLFGYNTSTNSAYIQSVWQSHSTTKLNLNPSGGDLTIGNASSAILWNSVNKLHFGKYNSFVSDTSHSLISFNSTSNAKNQTLMFTKDNVSSSFLINASSTTSASTGNTIIGTDLNPNIIFKTGMDGNNTDISSTGTIQFSITNTGVINTGSSSTTGSSGTVSQSGNIVTWVTGTNFSGINTALVGGIIVINGQTPQLITSYTDSTHITVSNSQTVSANTYTIYYGGTQFSKYGLGTIKNVVDDGNGNMLVNGDVTIAATKNLISNNEIRSGASNNLILNGQASSINGCVQIRNQNAIALNTFSGQTYTQFNTLDNAGNMAAAGSMTAAIIKTAATTYVTGTAYQSGTTITGVSTIFPSAVVGGIIVFNGGTQAYITGWTSGTSLTASPSQTVSSNPGVTYTIYYNGGVQLVDYIGNNFSRPALTKAGVINPYKIHAVYGLSSSNDDGFLRICAGGGTSTSTIPWMDLSGYSQIGDMNTTLTMGTGSIERFRLDGNAVNINSTVYNSIGTGITVTQSSTTVTASSGTPFTSSMVGGLIYIGPNAPQLINAVTNSTHLEVVSSNTYGTALDFFITYGGIQNKGIMGIGNDVYMNGDFIMTTGKVLSTKDINVASGSTITTDRISVNTRINLSDGSNKIVGTAILPTGTPNTITVNNTLVTGVSRIFLSHANDTANNGTLCVSATVAGTSFTIKSTNTSDASIVNWMIIN
jgi:hypothetical protein